MPIRLLGQIRYFKGEPGPSAGPVRLSNTPSPERLQEVAQEFRANTGRELQGEARPSLARPTPAEATPQRSVRHSFFDFEPYQPPPRELTEAEQKALAGEWRSAPTDAERAAGDFHPHGEVAAPTRLSMARPISEQRLQDVIREFRANAGLDLPGRSVPVHEPTPTFGEAAPVQLSQAADPARACPAEELALRNRLAAEAARLSLVQREAQAGTFTRPLTEEEQAAGTF